MSTIAFQSLREAETHLWNEISQTLHCGFWKATNREEVITYAAEVKGALRAQVLSDTAEEEIKKLLFKRIEQATNKVLKRKGWTLKDPCGCGNRGDSTKAELAAPLKLAISNVNALKDAMAKMDREEVDWKKSYMAMSQARDEHYMCASYKDRERIIILINLHNLKHPEQPPIRFKKL
jgi:hypothetical protein